MNDLTGAEKELLGIHPGVTVDGVAAPVLVKTKNSASSMTGVHTDSASGCSGWVCMQIYGDGAYVAAWDTQW